MSINKDPIRVGGENSLDPTTQLPMYRRFTTFNGSRDDEEIRVYYEEWLESNGAKVNFYSNKCYVVVDHAEIGHAVAGDPNADPPTQDEYIIDNSYAPMFSYGWYFKPVLQSWVGTCFGRDIIVGAINDTLQNHIPFNAPKEYYTRP